MIAHARLTRCGIFTYHTPQGVRRELRLPEDVFSPETMRSFRSRSVTNEHPDEMVDGKNWKRHTIGWLSGKPKQDGDHVLGKLYFPSADDAKKLWRQGRRQVSLGYSCSLEETPGDHPQYGKYDAIQRDIRGNHCAIVDVARAGHTAAVRLDAIARSLPGSVRFDSAICIEIAPAPIRRRQRLDGILGRPTLDSVAAQVDAQLRCDYPAPARQWVKGVSWTGPERVSLDQIDFSGAPWKTDHVDHFVTKIDKGWEKPIILMRRPDGKLDVVDGHNRAMAYRKMGMQPLAYVADSDQPTGPWSTMHDGQRNKFRARADGLTCKEAGIRGLL